jgi:hypothetical protein
VQVLPRVHIGPLRVARFSPNQHEVAFRTFHYPQVVVREIFASVCVCVCVSEGVSHPVRKW